MPKGFTEVLEETLSIGESEKRTAGVAEDVRHGQLCRKVEHKLWCLGLPKSPGIKQCKANVGKAGGCTAQNLFLMAAAASWGRLGGCGVPCEPMLKEGCQWGVCFWSHMMINVPRKIYISHPRSTHHECQKDDRCQWAAWRAFFMRRISKREHALAAGTVINKMVSSQLLACECPADAALSSRQCCGLTGFIPQRIYSQGWNCPPVAHTGVFGYVHPGTKGLLWRRFFHWFSRHWDASQEGTSRKLLFLSICLPDKAPAMSG